MPNYSYESNSKNRYGDYLLNDEEMYSSDKKDSYLNKEYWDNIFEQNEADTGKVCI